MKRKALAGAFGALGFTLLVFLSCAGPMADRTTPAGPKASGEDIVAFVEAAQKDPAMDRAKIAQIVDDIVTGKATYAEEPLTEEEFAQGRVCINKVCRATHCVTRVGSSLVCSNCCQ